MKKQISGFCLVLAAMGLFLVFSVPAHAVVVNFDNIPIPIEDGAAPIPTYYAGFTWDVNFYVEDNGDYSIYYGNTVTFPSSPNATYNAYGVQTIVTSRNSPFDFTGAYFSTWARNKDFYPYSSHHLTVRGFRGGKPVGTPVEINLTTSFVWTAANLQGVDQLVFETSETGEHWWMMDNFTYVPVPPSLVLLGSGLLCLAGFRKVSGLITCFPWRIKAGPAPALPLTGQVRKARGDDGKEITYG